MVFVLLVWVRAGGRARMGGHRTLHEESLKLRLKWGKGHAHTRTSNNGFDADLESATEPVVLREYLDLHHRRTFCRAWNA